MHPRFLGFVAATAALVPAVLLLDRSGIVPQLLLGAATALFLWLAIRSSPVPSRQIGWAIAFATTGELLLSAAWGLYSYQHAFIPLYVPVGHGVFYLLAAESAEQGIIRRHAQSIIRAVLAGGSIVAAISLFFFDDVWGLMWWLVAAALVMRSRNALLLSVCFVYTMVLEWLGTGLGNWRWAAAVPFVGLPSGNPPSGVGLLYILLDLATVAVWSELKYSESYAGNDSQAHRHLHWWRRRPWVERGDPSDGSVGAQPRLGVRRHPRGIQRPAEA